MSSWHDGISARISLCACVRLNPELPNLKVTILKWSTSYFNLIIRNEFTIRSWIGLSMMPNECHRGTAFLHRYLCACVRIRRVSTKRGGICIGRGRGVKSGSERERGWAGNGIEFYAIRFVRGARHVRVTGVIVRMHACTHACTHACMIFDSSSLRFSAVCAGAARYGRKSFIYSFTTGPKKRGKYRLKEDL